MQWRTLWKSSFGAVFINKNFFSSSPAIPTNSLDGSSGTITMESTLRVSRAERETRLRTIYPIAPSAARLNSLIMTSVLIFDSVVASSVKCPETRTDPEVGESFSDLSRFTEVNESQGTVSALSSHSATERVSSVEYLRGNRCT